MEDFFDVVLPALLQFLMFLLMITVVVWLFMFIGVPYGEIIAAKIKELAPVQETIERK